MRITQTIIFSRTAAFRALAYTGSELFFSTHSSDRNSPAYQSGQADRDRDRRQRGGYGRRPDRQSGRQRDVAPIKTRENIALYVRHRTEQM